MTFSGHCETLRRFVSCYLILSLAVYPEIISLSLSFVTVSDKITSYTDYVYNLDRLTVYVSDVPELDYKGLAEQHKCGVVTRKNTALFNPRLHFDCPEPLKGRYVYVKATGVSNRWRKLFNVVLCEVMVY